MVHVLIKALHSFTGLCESLSNDAFHRISQTTDVYFHVFPPTGEQHMYKCLSCPFSSMTISQLKEHSLRDHGEALTLPKLRAATQAAHAALRPYRLASNTEQTPSTPDGNYAILLVVIVSDDWLADDRFGKSILAAKAENIVMQNSVKYVEKRPLAFSNLLNFSA